MIDSVKLRLETQATDSLDRVLTQYQERADPKTGDLERGGILDGIRVRAGVWGYTIQGSLPKYRFGNNLESLNRRGVGEVIEELGERLGLPLVEARVSTLEIGQNLTMLRPPVDYMGLLLEAPYLHRYDYRDRESVCFSNGVRSFTFYDKNREIQRGNSARRTIPDLFSGKNVLRYEARFKRKVGGRFGRAVVCAKDLSDGIFYIQGVNKWKEEYFLIKKLRKDWALNMKGQKEYLRSLAYYGLLSLGGAEVALDIIKGGRQKGGSE